MDDFSIINGINTSGINDNSFVDFNDALDSNGV